MIVLLAVFCPGGLFSSATGTPQELPRRTVLFEMFTGTWCGWCPYGEESRVALAEKYDDFITITYHDNDKMEIPAGKQINELIVTLWPSATIDRKRFDGGRTPTLGRDVWEERLVEERKTRSPISIDLEGSYNSASRKMTVSAVICSYMDFYAELRINVVVVEDSLEYTQHIYDKPYTELSSYYHLNVVRAMVTGALGEPLNDKPLKKQVCLKKDYTFTLEKNINPARSRIVVFIHENENKGFGTVHQAAMIPVIGAK
jgi:hypothetical protein